MDQQEELATNKTPLFTGDNYAHWSVRMKCHLMYLGYIVWRSVEIEFKLLANIPTDGDEENAKALNAILSGLT